ncbi:MAG: PPC domain-containing protein [Myxococcales bacterium]
MNRIKQLFALGATVAVLANQACNSSAGSAGRSRTSEAGREVTTAGTVAGLSLRVDLFPYALPGETFPVEVSFRNSSGQLMNVADNISISLTTNPTGATMLGSTLKAPTNGIARFDLSIAKVGQGYGLTASSTQAGTATSALFNVAYSQDVDTAANPAGYTLDSAPSISPKVPMFSALAPGEVQYYKFRASVGQQVSVLAYANRVDINNWDTAMRVRLLAPDGTTEVARAAAVTPDTLGVDQGISLLRIPQDGSYYIACEVDNAGFQAGAYAMVMTLAANPGLSLQMESEPWGTTGQNDTIATAQKLTPGNLYGHYESNAAGAPTSDFYAITLSGSVRVRVDLTAARSGGSYGDRPWVGRLELQDATGAVLWGNDRSYGLDPAIDYVITKAGTYYVRVTASDSPTSGGSGPYFLNYQSTPYFPTAETTTNTTASGATSIKYASDVSGSFSAAGSHYFAFGGTAGDVVRLIVQDRTMLQGATLSMTPTAATPASATTTAGTALAVAATADATFLRDDGVTELGVGYSFADASKSRLNYRQTILQTTGTYFVRVNSTTAGKFGLRLERLVGSARETEPNDAIAAANLIPTAGWISGAIGAAGDQDHFKVHAEAGQLMTVSVLGAAGAGLGMPLADWGSALVPSVEVRDSLGNLVSATSADRGGGFNFAETIQHPLVAQIGNVPPTVQTSFRAPAAGDYDVAVFDADGQGGPDYFYALHVWKNQ